MSQPTTAIIFGASGDLTRRKLIPALFRAHRLGRLPADFHVVGFARRPWDHDAFRALLKEGMETYAADQYDDDAWQDFSSRIWYSRGNLDQQADFEALRDFLDSLEKEGGNRLYYLATAPAFFSPVAHFLGDLGMARSDDGWRRLVVEKPFGTDLTSAGALNDALHEAFDETQIYRIDHYLGKETAQNILFLRFANTIFEPIWNRNYIENVQISVTEAVDVGHRAGYYDSAGVIRDMFQNHLFQLLGLIAMEPPHSFQATAVRNERAKLLSAVRSIHLEDTVRAQYEGYCTAAGVAADSSTPTYAALKLFIDNWRWQGVPFYLRSGKALAEKATEIIIQFRKPPHLMFDFIDGDSFSSNVLSICIQPDEGMHLQFEAKVPDKNDAAQSVDMEFHYRDSFKGEYLPDAYERLLLDAIQGDAALFARSDNIEFAWQLVDPVLEGWRQAPNATALRSYEPGSWGPAAADELLARAGHRWLHSCSVHD